MATVDRTASAGSARLLWLDRAGGAWAFLTIVATTVRLFRLRCSEMPVPGWRVTVRSREHVLTANVVTRSQSGAALLASNEGLLRGDDAWQTLRMDALLITTSAYSSAWAWVSIPATAHLPFTQRLNLHFNICCDGYRDKNTPVHLLPLPTASRCVVITSLPSRTPSSTINIQSGTIQTGCTLSATRNFTAQCSSKFLS